MTSAPTVRALIDAIAEGDAAAIEQFLTAAPQLARAALEGGATRVDAAANFLPSLGGYVYAGDTAVHIAGAAYRADLVRRLVGLDADVNARNRRGATPLHAAAVGDPDGRTWSPAAQARTIAALVALGAQVDGLDENGTTPLHRAVRTRCAAAVEALLAAGADPARPTRNGSSPLKLARLTTGRSGSGSAAAKAEQAAIIALLEEWVAA